MPIVPANMKSLVDKETCLYFAQNNLFYIMHRFGVNNIDFCRFMQDNNKFTSISVGIKEDSLLDLKNLKNHNINPDFMTIDVAYAWNKDTEKIVKTIKDNFTSFVIVGNIGDGTCIEELDKWGTDAYKAGIGGGKSCITKNKTGFFTPMATLISDVSKQTNKPIIADGGIREHGDIAKAIACGATIVMAGSLFAGYEQSSGDIVEIDGKRYKEYYGNASEFTKGMKKHVEGKKILEPFKGDMCHLLRELKEDLQSSISYAGGNQLFDLRNAEIFTI